MNEPFELMNQPIELMNEHFPPEQVEAEYAVLSEIFVNDIPITSPEKGYISSSVSVYRGTSLIRNSAPLGSYSRTMPRDLWWC